jgi:hypothetical protein
VGTSRGGYHRISRRTKALPVSWLWDILLKVGNHPRHIIATTAETVIAVEKLRVFKNSLVLRPLF